jgi:DNA polymerase III subunit gamma/tau
MDGTDQDGAARGPYRVLARKYRPTSFADLIGQEPTVRTLTNAFRTGRIAQAYMLTGVRGVGKTTTARILARALNYSIPGKVEIPSIELEELGEHCTAIMEGRHVDVIEMDAASHTGIDDIREIIEASRYRPSIARYKVYIIDEVHMLSKAAFNGLLKTLEEPPEHVKFIFATTEIRKVPVTVLSRCQRFDLRRIEAGRLIELMQGITAAEGISVEEAAMRMIARAAEGSARDCLSLLDQAIAHAAGNVEAEAVRAMLGLADRATVIDLFEEIMRGDIAAGLTRLKALYEVGADPAVVLEDLATFTHLVTRMKLTEGAAEDDSLSEEERQRGKEFAGKISLRSLTRAWQMLLKGIDEARSASRPLAAADMVLVRLAHAADLPTPDEAIKAHRDGGGVRQEATANPAPPPDGGTRMASASGARSGSAIQQPAQSPAPVPQAAAAQSPRLESFADIVAMAGRERDLKLKHALETYVRLIRFEQGQIEVALTEHASRDFIGELSKKLELWTGQRWMIAVSSASDAKTIEETRASDRDSLVSDARADPVVAAVLAQFPGAEIVDVRVRADETDFSDGADMALPPNSDEIADEDD